MTENISIPSAITPLSPARAPANVGTPGASPAQGAAFKALLEQLEAQARELSEKSDRVDGPNELASAVDQAHASLQGALSLSERLLEAYRAERARTSASEGSAAKDSA